MGSCQSECLDNVVMVVVNGVYSQSDDFKDNEFSTTKQATPITSSNSLVTGGEEVLRCFFVLHCYLLRRLILGSI
jgi:hypothetical protein